MTNLIRRDNSQTRTAWKYGKHTLTYYQGLLIKVLKEHNGNKIVDTSFGQQIISLSKKGLVSYHKVGKEYHVHLRKG